MNSLQTDMRHAEGLERQYYVELLSKLYVACRYYPSSFEPGEDEIRVTKGGGKDEESEGLLLGRHRVVMKRVPERDRAGIEQKAAEWKQLRHPNVVPFLGLHTIDSTMYIVSPWMENGDAPRYMERNPDTDSRRLLLQAAEGLKYLHGLSPAVVHGNLRGSNILIDGAGEAHLAGMEFSPAVQAETGGLPSTSRWQAPELLKSRAGQEVLVTPASDMFSFGRIILELSQKDVPFAKIKDDAAILTRVTSGVSPARPPSIDARLWELYKECCHMRPERRPSAEVLVVRLQSLCSKKARTSVSLFGWK
ncbi:hypothetical protein BOTBODRAFT_125088 [Botryobasidium botryosum FD-172 SS1]|uniref:Protein kinase domain-containing protein n=1 Tax=Botryobasidium botryosum (strain FD-172 SS1) TaxID=930990 RepID=A0A067MZE6_BOTB1|nr:hypothetical protein BOTBODRAFT_125088 [Botryobasidium botryosum FD-172 SS1]